MFKKNYQIGEFFCSHFDIEGGRSNNISVLCFIISRKVKMQLKRKKRFVQYMEKVLWLIKHVKNGLWSFLVPVIFWPNNQPFAVGPSCALEAVWQHPWPLPTSSQQLETVHILKIIRISSYWWKWKMYFTEKKETDILATLMFLSSGKPLLFLPTPSPCQTTPLCILVGPSTTLHSMYCNSN